MDERKRKRLESAGWKLGSASEFLDMNDEEAALIELTLALANAAKNREPDVE